MPQYNEEFTEEAKQGVALEIDSNYYEKYHTINAPLSMWAIHDLSDFPERVGGHGGRLRNEAIITYVKLKIKVQSSWSSVVKRTNMRIMLVVGKNRPYLTAGDLPATDVEYANDDVIKVLSDQMFTTESRIHQWNMILSGSSALYTGTMNPSRMEFPEWFTEIKRKTNIYRHFYDNLYTSLLYEGNVYLCVKTDMPQNVEVYSRVYFKG